MKEEHFKQHPDWKWCSRDRKKAASTSCGGVMAPNNIINIAANQVVGDDNKKVFIHQGGGGKFEIDLKCSEDVDDSEDESLKLNTENKFNEDEEPSHMANQILAANAVVDINKNNVKLIPTIDKELNKSTSISQQTFNPTRIKVKETHPEFSNDFNDKIALRSPGTFKKRSPVKIQPNKPTTIVPALINNNDNINYENNVKIISYNTNIINTNSVNNDNNKIKINNDNNDNNNNNNINNDTNDNSIPQTVLTPRMIIVSSAPSVTTNPHHYGLVLKMPANQATNGLKTPLLEAQETLLKFPNYHLMLSNFNSGCNNNNGNNNNNKTDNNINLNLINRNNTNNNNNNNITNNNINNINNNSIAPQIVGYLASSLTGENDVQFIIPVSSITPNDKAPSSTAPITASTPTDEGLVMGNKTPKSEDFKGYIEQQIAQQLPQIIQQYQLQSFINEQHDKAFKVENFQQQGMLQQTQLQQAQKKLQTQKSQETQQMQHQLQQTYQPQQNQQTQSLQQTQKLKTQQLQSLHQQQQKTLQNFSAVSLLNLPQLFLVKPTPNFENHLPINETHFDNDKNNNENNKNNNNKEFSHTSDETSECQPSNNPIITASDQSSKMSLCL